MRSGPTLICIPTCVSAAQRKTASDHKGLCISEIDTIFCGQKRKRFVKGVASSRKQW